MGGLIDSFGRTISYLRLSVIDHCNYRCFYCMPKEATGSERVDLLTVEQTVRLARLFAELGIRKIRLTGGEPLLRRDLPELAGQLSQLPGIEDLSLSTNGHLLERFAEPLHRAGVQRLNISLDSLDPVNFTRITAGGDLRAVLRGIDAALAAQFRPVKLNMVVMKDVNDREIESMFEFALTREVELRFIETMPVGPQGMHSMTHYYPASRIMERLTQHCGADLIPINNGKGAGPARYYRAGTGGFRVGIISAMSQHFCEGCNRVRLTAQGVLVLCLGQENSVSLAAALHEGGTDEEIKGLIRKAIARKPARHDFHNPMNAPLRPMYSLGG